MQLAAQPRAMLVAANSLPGESACCPGESMFYPNGQLRSIRRIPVQRGRMKPDRAGWVRRPGLRDSGDDALRGEDSDQALADGRPGRKHHGAPRPAMDEYKEVRNGNTAIELGPTP